MITENLSTLKIHKLTQEQYDRELDAGRIDENALYLTPADDVDLSGYATIDYVDNEIRKIPTSDVEGQIEDHNIDDDAHPIILEQMRSLSAEIANKADASHGNHVPEIESADNTKFLRSDNTWQNVTPENIGAAPSSHDHDDRYYDKTEVDTALSAISFPVYSVNGKTGAVSLTASDVGARSNTWLPNAYDVNAVPVTRTINGQPLSSDVVLSAGDVGAYTTTDIDSKLSGKSDTNHNHDDLYCSEGTVGIKIDAHNTSTAAHNDLRDLISGLTTRLNTLADCDDTTLDQMSEVVAYIKNNKSLIEGITTSKVNVSDIVNDLTTNITDKPLSAAQGVVIKNLIDLLEEELDSHTGNTTVHITSTERTNWNSAKTHADAAHAPSNAEKNQNAFSNVVVGSTTIAADSATDTLTLVAGSNITLTPDAANDKVTIAATDTVYTHPTYTSKSSGLYKITVDGTGHVSGTAAVAKSDITALGIPAQDTTYSTATTGAAGLMSAAMVTKLNGIATGANAYSHPTYTSKSSGLYKITVDGTGHVSGTTAVTKSDITALGIPAQDTTYNLGSFGITATAAELNYCDGVTSNIQTQLNGKAASSHGTHVTYGTSASALGTSSAGSASTVSRSDHVHALPALTSCTGTLTVAKGGTGSSNGATGLKNLFAAGNTILSSYQYGSSLPSSGTAGQLFFLLAE